MKCRVPVIDKEALSKRTQEYKKWVEAYARKQSIPMQWGEKVCAKRTSCGLIQSRRAMSMAMISVSETNESTATRGCLHQFQCCFDGM